MLLNRCYCVLYLLFKWPCCYSRYVCVIVHVSVCAGRSLSAVLPWPVIPMCHMSPEFLMVPLSAQRGYYFIDSVLNLEKGLHARYGLTFPTGSSLDSPVWQLLQEPCLPKKSRQDQLWDLPHWRPCPFPIEEWMAFFSKQQCVHWSRGVSAMEVEVKES